MITIYALCCPVKHGRVRYVGRSKQPRRRLAEHLVLNDGTPKAIWIRGLRAQNLRPEMIVLEVVPAEHSRAAEAVWIESLEASGARLLNLPERGRR